jgi:hypothetical protein
MQYRKELTIARSASFYTLIEENNYPKCILIRMKSYVCKKQHSPSEDGLHFRSDEFVNFFNEEIMEWQGSLWLEHWTSN